MTASLPEFVAAGEALTDLIRVDGASDQWVAKTGGSTWNVARAAAAFGLRSAFAGAISRCCFGDALWGASEAAGLDLRFLQRVERSPLLAVVPQARPPQYFFIGDDSADLHFDAAALPEGWQSAAAWMHFGGISLAREPLASRLLSLADAQRSRGASLSYDANFRRSMDAARYAPTFERLCRLADVIKLSDEDLRGLMPDLDTEAALWRVRSFSARAWLLYTEGAAGARLITPEGRWRADAPRVDVVDTVGAGDASIAGLVASRMQRPQADAATHLAFAVAAGSAACQTEGAHPPSRAAVDALARGVQPVPA